MDGIDKIINEENVKGTIDELCADIKDFDNVEFMFIFWGTRKDSITKERYYGKATELIAGLERSKFSMLRDIVCEGEDEVEDEESQDD